MVEAPLRPARRLPVALVWVLAMCAGWAQAFATAWPFAWGLTPGAPVWTLQLAALALLVQALGRCASARQSFATGLWFSCHWLLATVWWLFVSMYTYGGLPALFAALALLALALTLALYYAVSCALYWQLGARTPGLLPALGFAALWTLAELARGTWFTGFGWGAIAYAHVDGPLAGYAPWLGAYGVGALAAWLAATLGQRWRWQSGALALGLLLLGWALPTLAPRFGVPGGTLAVTLLQGNIPQDEKFVEGAGVQRSLDWYGDKLLHSRGDLVVAPETAIPVLPQELAPGYWDGLLARFRGPDQGALIGIPWGDYEHGYTNSVMALGARAEPVQRYDKHHLVPFGEFIPPLFKWFTRLMQIPLGDFNRGAVGQPSFVWKGQRLAPNICYEDLFGEELGARFRDPALAPTILVNLSNLGWFGDTVIIDQHLQISRMRALEFQRPVLRATNTGPTAIVDAQGRVTAALPRLQAGVLEGTVQGASGTTPYAWWVSRFGLWPLWILCVAIYLIARRSMPTRLP